MALPIVWSQVALRKLNAIAGYIAEFDEPAAERLRARIEGSVLPASEHPYMFREGRREGTREVVAHPNYVLVYRVLPDRIRVLSVIHTRQQYP